MRKRLIALPALCLALALLLGGCSGDWTDGSEAAVADAVRSRLGLADGIELSIVGVAVSGEHRLVWLSRGSDGRDYVTAHFYVPDEDRWGLVDVDSSVTEKARGVYVSYWTHGDSYLVTNPDCAYMEMGSETIDVDALPFVINSSPPSACAFYRSGGERIE